MDMTGFFHIQRDEKLRLELHEASGNDDQLCLDIRCTESGCTYTFAHIFAPRDTMIDALTTALDEFINMGAHVVPEAEKPGVVV